MTKINSIQNELLRIAHISGVHGLAGRVKVAVVTSFPERLHPGAVVFVGTEDSVTEYTIRGCDLQRDKGLVFFEGISTPEAALKLKGFDVFIPKREAEETRSALDDDTFYYYELIGCDVFVESKKFGVVTDILETGNTILVVKSLVGDEFMVPFVSAMVDTARLNERCIDITPVDGLFDRNE